MPATSQEPSERFASSRSDLSNRRLWSTKEGVGETSGQTAAPHLSTGLALVKNGSAEERSFLHRCGSRGPQFHRRSLSAEIWSCRVRRRPHSPPLRCRPASCFPKIAKFS